MESIRKRLPAGMDRVWRIDELAHAPIMANSRHQPGKISFQMLTAHINSQVSPFCTLLYHRSVSFCQTVSNKEKSSRL